MASVSRATCWVTSTSATARSRVALRMESPSVQTSTTSPVVASPRCHSDDRPGQQPDGQYHGDAGMDDAQLFEIAKAAPARRQFPVDGSVKPVVLEAEAAECAHQRHVVDDIDHLAIDGRGLVGEVVVQRSAGSRQMEHRHDHRTGDHDQARRHRQAHGSNQGDRRNRRHAWRQHVPDEHVFDREHRIRGRGDAAGQHARQAVRKIAWRVSGKMAENVAAQVPCHSHKGEARRPAGNPPQQIVGRDQRHEKNECQPYATRTGGAGRQAVDQVLHAILRPHRTRHRRNYGGQDHHMRRQALAEVAQHKRKRTVCIS